MAIGFGAGPRIRCLNCRTVIQSMHRHDMQSCKCNDVAVDGGSDYMRVLSRDKANWEYVDPPEAA